jgi:hypothetical protein
MLDDFQRFVRVALLAIAESGHVGCFHCHRKVRTVESIVKFRRCPVSD